MLRYKHLFGPVPSRRLGRSLGVDPVPFKTCTYDCIYCQLGPTTNKTLRREPFVSPQEVQAEITDWLQEGGTADYITFSGSGEPTLNSHLSQMITTVKELTEIPVAVLTNGSLLWMSEVQEAVMKADLVLPSLDAGDEHVFRYVNRPHRQITFERMVNGIVEFTARFPGAVWLEVFLLAGFTGIPSEAEKIAVLAKRIRPARVQLNTVTRPPAEGSALALSWDQMLGLKGLFAGQTDIISESQRHRALVSMPHDAREADILALLSRRPCTSEHVAEGLGIHVAEALKYLDPLVASGRIKTVLTGGRNFYTVTGSGEPNGP